MNIAHWSFRCPCQVNWPLYVTIKESWNTKQTISWISSREKAIFVIINRVVRAVDSLFFFSFFFNDGTAGIGKKNCASFHVSKNRDKFLVSCYVKFPAIKKVIMISHCANSKKKKKASSDTSDKSCFFTHNGITTPKTTREGQESTAKTRLHFAWPPKFKNQALFTPRAQNRCLFLDYFYAVAGRNLEACLAAWKSSIS